MNTIFTLRASAHFIFEERTESYKNTVKEHSQKKNVQESKMPAELSALQTSRLAGV